MTMLKEIYESIDHLFRRHAGQMVSALARHFGYQHLELIEDSVQDALVAAMKKWPFTGEPENARAWLVETAKNRVIDRLRHEKRNEVLDETTEFVAQGKAAALFKGEIDEDELRMIFACCHPAIPRDAQVALTLKTVGGFSVGEIAHAFLSNNEAIAKMLTRAKAKFCSHVAELEIPFQDELARRSDSVLKVLYLMFNEGYVASEGEDLVRKDLCFEAIRLASLVTKHPLTRSPKAHALLALFLFQAARLDTRIDSNGELLLLEEQDRSRWNKVMLSEGLKQFRLSAAGHELSDYHLEAEIAAEHALAADFASTNWQRILDSYDELQRRKFSPVAELNRIVAIEKLHGAAAARSALDNLSEQNDLSGFNLFHITSAHLLARTGNLKAAVSELNKARDLTSNIPLRRFVESKLEDFRDNPI
jgi:RNA polymerase sigma factor (sigma-70 family)